MRARITLAAAMLFGVATLVLTGCGTTVISSPEDALDTVTTQGLGETVAPPDTAELTFGSSTIAPDAEEALEAVSATAAAIADAVKGTGVADADIQTADVSVFPEYDYREGRAPRITAYRASTSVRVKVRDLAAVGQAISAASDAGATEINGPAFTLDDDTEATTEAISRAVENARMRAEAMARAGGKTLGEVRVMSETEVSMPPIYREARALSELDAADSFVPIETGQLDITARVTVVFELK